MGREVKRVPLDFSHPLGAAWPGFVDGSRTEPPAGDGWQVWETVSDGSPITPVLPTAEALVEYLCTVGTTWDQRAARERDEPLPSREACRKFVKAGWVPSAMFVGGRMLSGIHAAIALGDE